MIDSRGFPKALRFPHRARVASHVGQKPKRQSNTSLLWTVDCGPSTISVRTWYAAVCKSLYINKKEKKKEMVRRAFRMQLHRGFEEEYKRRHEAVWPELKDLLKKNGISEYSIFLDETTNTLFGVMQVEDPAQLENLPGNPLMKKWWAYMQDIMDTHPDNSPVSVPLNEVFYLP